MLLPLSVTVYIVATTVCVTLINLLLLSLLLAASVTVTAACFLHCDCFCRFCYIVYGPCYGGGEGVFPYSLGGGVPLGSRKSYLLLDQMLQIL